MERCKLCGCYTITAEDIEKLRMAHKEPGQHGDPVGETGFDPLKTIKAEVAREIFEEIGRYIALNSYQGDAFTGRFLSIELEDDIAELKKKYTEGTDDR